MIPYNAGNILPFYTQGYGSGDRRWQRHRQFGTDLVPFGLPCPRTRLMPFQVYYSGVFSSITSFALVNPEDDTETVVLDTALLETSIKGDNSGFWITWKADQDLDVIPDCGYWYVFLNVSGQPPLVSEVLDCLDLCGFDHALLEVVGDSCSENSPNFSLTLRANIAAVAGYSYTIRQQTGILEQVLSTNTDAVMTAPASSESRTLRLKVDTACGTEITVEYLATWDSGDPCGTFELGTPTITVDEAGILTTGAVWRLNFSHSSDKANVLYQTGYKQYLYLPLPVWDVPTVARDVEVAVNGNGEELRRFTRTVERRGFEVADLPDYVLGFLTKAGDLDTILFEDAKLIDSLQPVNFEVDNLTFESPNRQGTALNVGRFYFDVEAEAFQGCQENFVLD